MSTPETKTVSTTPPTTEVIKEDSEMLKTAISERLEQTRIPAERVHGVVAVGFGNKLKASEAAEVLGCSYSYIMQLIQKNKFRAQKKDGVWMLDADEVYKAKNSGMIKPRPQKDKAAKAWSESVLKKAVDSSRPETVSVQGNVARVSFEIDRTKLELVNTVLISTGSNVQKFLSEQVEELYTRVMGQLTQAIKAPSKTLKKR